MSIGEGCHCDVCQVRREKDAQEPPLPPGTYAAQVDAVFDGISPSPSGRQRVLRVSYDVNFREQTRRVQQTITRKT